MICVCFQLRVLQAVVCEKDVRFQEQIQKHEEELLKVSETQSQNDSEPLQVQYFLACFAFINSFILD